jgi:DNA-binding CsgD family transcriptional regulator
VDALGIVSHPAPGLVTVLTALSDRPIEVAPYERRLLMRIALHMDAGHRVRRHPERVMAEMTADGRVLSRSNDAPPAARLEAHGAYVTESRSRLQRSDAGAVELWSAMLAGRVTLVPRGGRSSRARYVVLDNPPEVHSLRALTPAEVAVLAMAARGVSSKLIAYGLGIGPSAVSTRLASAAAKIGVMSRTDLVRVAAILARDSRANLPAAVLTAAEHEILDGLRRGLSNRELAAERSRSIRTIANQVASLLKKTASPSRRALVARAPRPVGP